MENIFYISGTTTDGKSITFDGSCVESFIPYQDESGKDCVELNFKSGKTINVYSEVDEDTFGEGECIESLVDVCIGYQFHTSIKWR